MLTSSGEPRHGQSRQVVDSVFSYDFNNGNQKNAKIKPETLMIYIPGVQYKFFFPRYSITPVDLGLTAEAGRHIMAASLLGGIEGQVLHQ